MDFQELCCLSKMLRKMNRVKADLVVSTLKKVSLGLQDCILSRHTRPIADD